MFIWRYANSEWLRFFLFEIQIPKELSCVTKTHLFGIDKVTFSLACWKYRNARQALLNLTFRVLYFYSFRLCRGASCSRRLTILFILYSHFQWNQINNQRSMITMILKSSWISEDKNSIGLPVAHNVCLRSMNRKVGFPNLWQVLLRTGLSLVNVRFGIIIYFLDMWHFCPSKLDFASVRSLCSKVFRIFGFSQSFFKSLFTF